MRMGRRNSVASQSMTNLNNSININNNNNMNKQGNSEEVNENGKGLSLGGSERNEGVKNQNGNSIDERALIQSMKHRIDGEDRP
ncbi:hypothetical protein U3516DRAFT_918977 [Neocallimastix sp. 'constans']